jgi:23S rRNA (pseudouridine1915-N3)-methyltransferase
VKLVVVAVGKLKERALRDAADEYLGRLRRYVRCEELEVKNDAALESALPGEAFVVALEVGGEALTSRGFAERLARWTGTGKGVVAFLIGGADGIPAELSASAGARLSLSSLTLPHRLARVLLYEQLYRAMTIQRGEPYAREN